MTSNTRAAYKSTGLGTFTTGKLKPKRMLGNPKDEPPNMLMGIPRAKRAKEAGNLLLRRNRIKIVPKAKAINHPAGIERLTRVIKPPSSPIKIWCLLNKASPAFMRINPTPSWMPRIITLGNSLATLLMAPVPAIKSKKVAIISPEADMTLGDSPPAIAIAATALRGCTGTGRR